MKRDELPDDLRLTEAQVREAIELALREPPASADLSMAERREIAAELDIDEASLTKAVRQVLAGATSAATPVAGSASAPGAGASRVLAGRAMALGSFAAALGVFTTYVESGALDGLLNRTTDPGRGAFIDVPAALLLIAVTIITARARRFPRERLLFLAEATATWLGFGLGWAIGHGSVTGDLTRFVISAIAGSALLAWFLSRRTEDPSRVSAARQATGAPDGRSALPLDGDRARRRITHWATVLRRTSSLSPRQSAT